MAGPERMAVFATPVTGHHRAVRVVETGEVAVASSSVRAPVTLRLPFSATSVSVARQQLRTWMSDNGCDRECVEDARVIISELVANSVRHAQPLADGSVLVTWILDDGGVQVGVTDGGSGTRPRNMHAPSSALAGRGMSIVEMLSLRWWTERSDSRSTVRALLRC
jgi:serine/threonine-protein kinase RsbW